ncbi:MAG: hypothetical protein LLF94_12155 [Chlamydiales bacterium]|nr:hypothetical protein [Chlamydiales bacterium]
MSEPEAKYKTQSESPMKRFFLVSYAKLNADGFGSMGFSTDGVFPKKKDIFDGVKKSTDHEIGCLISIFEFKSEKEYNDFIAE